MGSAISVFGTIMLFLSLLIISSRNYDGRRGGHGWWAANALMVVLLLCASITGHTCGLMGMANTATTFAVLYALELYSEFHVERGWNGWVLILMISLAAWRGSLWLHAHPSYIVSMFTL